MIKKFNETDLIDFKLERNITLNYFDCIKNSNKFYTIELHKKNECFKIFTDYGRVGVSSKKEIREYFSSHDAIIDFEKILKSKKRKGYTEVDLAQASTGSTSAKEVINISKVNVVKGNDTIKTLNSKEKLSKDVEEFIKQIFEEANQKLQTLVKGNIKGEGNPLGKLSLQQIDEGRNILQKLAYLLNAKNDNLTVQEALELSNKFYKIIPKSFGRKIIPEKIAIKTLSAVNENLDILSFYEDMLSINDTLYKNDCVYDQYKDLECDIEVLSKRTKEYKDIVNYVKSTESNHHNVSLEVKRIFTVNQKNAPKFDDSMGNVKQLFHGTRSANVAAILKNHLKLPDKLKGVHITGAMFGPGLYFADQSTKSSQYSNSKFGGTCNKYNTSFMFLVDVSLGKIKEVSASKYYNNAPRGYNSVKGVEGSNLLHNEYIIYNENQQKIRYIIEFKTTKRK